ncbi:hypothetical protein GQ600_18331 [Phytophthora cactorum]|nr:hypothetical protein GQ600_18331 [Phytophthora cactorum]
MPLHKREDGLVSQETTTTVSGQRSIGDQDARRRIDQPAQASAVAHHHTLEGICRVRQHQDALVSKRSEYRQQQHDRQLGL